MILSYIEFITLVQDFNKLQVYITGKTSQVGQTRVS